MAGLSSSTPTLTPAPHEVASSTAEPIPDGADYPGALSLLALKVDRLVAFATLMAVGVENIGPAYNKDDVIESLLWLNEEMAREVLELVRKVDC